MHVKDLTGHDILWRLCLLQFQVFSAQEMDVALLLMEDGIYLTKVTYNKISI